MQQHPFGPDFVVVRSGQLKDPEIMKQNATDEYRETGRWAISVACASGMTRDELAEAAFGPRGRYYCATDVATIRDGGYEIDPDGRSPHALLKLGDAPADDADDMTAQLEAVTALFHGPYPNPGYAGGRK